MIEADLIDLVDNPRETLEIELKALVDFRDKVQRAKLARHLCALANHGGGFLVLGFDDNLKAQTVPSTLTLHRDDVSNVVSTFLQPAFLCDLEVVRSSLGNPHPIIRVPGHGVIPVSAQIDGPTVNGKVVGLKAGRLYIRKVTANGPASVPISSPDDWTALIRRCTLADRESFISSIEELMKPRQISITGSDRLQLWHTAAHRAFISAIKASNAEWPIPMERNHYGFSYAVLTRNDERIPDSDLIAALNRANASVRQLVWTGWSMFYPFKPEEIAPYFIVDASSGTERSFLESSLLNRRIFSSTLPDFWRVAPSGMASLFRLYREDRTGEHTWSPPGSSFSPFLLVREIAEVLSHAHALSRNFQSTYAIALNFEWTGLKDRKIRDGDSDDSKNRTARTDTKTVKSEWPIADVANRWPEIVADTASEVCRLFDPTFRIDAEWVKYVSERFRVAGLTEP